LVGLKAACVAALLLRRAPQVLVGYEVFNTTVENSVENKDRIPVSASAGNASTFCTEVSAGTFVAWLR
jgi:hypothetical protein